MGIFAHSNGPQRLGIVIKIVIPAKPNYIKTMQLKENVFYKTRTGIKVYAKPNDPKHSTLWDYFDAQTHIRITNVYANGRATTCGESDNDLVGIWEPFLKVGRTYKTRNGEHEVLVEKNDDVHFKVFLYKGIIAGDAFDETYNCYYHENGQMDSVVKQDWDLVEEVKDHWEVRPGKVGMSKAYDVILNGVWQASFRASSEAEAWMASQQ